MYFRLWTLNFTHKLWSHDNKPTLKLSLKYDVILTIP